MLSDKFSVRGHHAAEVLRPRSIRRAIDDDVPDPFVTEFLRVRREAEEAIDLALGEELHGLGRWVRYPADIPIRIEAHLGQHTCEKNVLAGAEFKNRDS